MRPFGEEYLTVYSEMSYVEFSREAEFLKPLLTNGEIICCFSNDAVSPCLVVISHLF